MKATWQRWERRPKHSYCPRWWLVGLAFWHCFLGRRAVTPPNCIDAAHRQIYHPCLIQQNVTRPQALPTPWLSAALCHFRWWGQAIRLPLPPPWSMVPWPPHSDHESKGNKAHPKNFSSLHVWKQPSNHTSHKKQTTDFNKREKPPLLGHVSIHRWESCLEHPTNPYLPGKEPEAGIRHGAQGHTASNCGGQNSKPGNPKLWNTAILSSGPHLPVLSTQKVKG